MAALILPTSLFQAVSASIDPLSTALAVLSISCFLSIYEKGQTAPSWLFLVMASSLVIVCGSRAHMLPMLTLMVIASFKHRSKIAWTSTLLSIMATVAWLSVAIPSTIDLRVTRALSTGEIALFYLNIPTHQGHCLDIIQQNHPGLLCKILPWKLLQLFPDKRTVHRHHHNFPRTLCALHTFTSRLESALVGKSLGYCSRFRICSSGNDCHAADMDRSPRICCSRRSGKILPDSRHSDTDGVVFMENNQQMANSGSTGAPVFLSDSRSHFPCAAYFKH